MERTGLTQIVQQPTRGASILDRVCVSCPQMYATVRVVESVVRSDHKAVVLHPDQNHWTRSKRKTQRTFRFKYPTQNTLFLQHIANITFNNPTPTASSLPSISTQAEFDYFYTTALDLLNKFYPERTMTMTSRDPEYTSNQE